MLAMFTTLGVALWKSSTVSLSSPDSSGSLSSGICTPSLVVKLTPVDGLLHQSPCMLTAAAQDAACVTFCWRAVPSSCNYCLATLYLHGLSGCCARPEREALGPSFVGLAPQQPKGQHCGPHKAQQPAPPLLLHIAQGLMGPTCAGSRVEAGTAGQLCACRWGVERAEASLNTVEESCTASILKGCHSWVRQDWVLKMRWNPHLAVR